MFALLNAATIGFTFMLIDVYYIYCQSKKCCKSSKSSEPIEYSNSNNQNLPENVNENQESIDKTFNDSDRNQCIRSNPNEDIKNQFEVFEIKS
mgnify:CR=1 FL=1